MSTRRSSKVHQKLTKQLARAKVTSADTIAGLLLAADERDLDGNVCVRLTAKGPFAGVLGPKQTSTRLRDKLLALDLVRPSIGVGQYSWMFPLSPTMLALVDELENESKGKVARDKEMTLLSARVSRLEADNEAIWAAIRNIEERDPPVTTEKIQRHLAVVK